MAARNLERRVLIAERLTHFSQSTFDAVLGKLRSSMPRVSYADIVELAETTSDEAEFARLIEERFDGQSGFYLYGELDYGGWIHASGVDRRVIRLVLGHPMITATMMRLDVTSALFSPMEILLVESEETPGCAIVHMRPSTLIALEPEARLLRAAAEGLDDKIAKLIRSAADEGAPG